jgi:cell division protease FtsH
MNSNNNKKQAPKRNIRDILMIVLVAVICVGVFVAIMRHRNTPDELTYNKFITYVNDGSITSIEARPVGNGGNAKLYVLSGEYKVNSTVKKYEIIVSDETVSMLAQMIDSGSADFSLEYSELVTVDWLSIISIIILPVGAILLLVFMFRNTNRSNNQAFDFAKSRAKLNRKATTTFADVAGADEEKEEMQEIIEYLKNPKKFSKMGARIPRGVIMVGPPGTGKTLLAKAVAGEANVPFYSISGSDFVEMFVGVGASRVRDLFEQAKKHQPCIVFIDEIDAVGRQRGTGLGGGHDEREQTLNQLLTEMDGFGANEGIIIIAATNRPDVLDPALLRPGRFDRQVTVNLPDVKGREEILGVHAKNKILSEGVTLKNLAKRTPGFSGADLENLLNEAALLAVRRNKTKITMDEIDEGTDRVLMGPAKTTRKITDKEKKLVSIHEAGHAVIGLKLEDAEVVHKITIIPRGVAGGYTMMLPKEEKVSVMTKDELLARITGLLGGRVAEEHFLHEMSTGASDDFKKATAIARSMVTEYGMSELGPMQYEEHEKGVFLGRDYGKNKDFSDQVALEIDRATRKIIDECYEKAKKLIADNEALVSLLSDALVKYETLTKEQIDSLVLNGVMPELVEEEPEEVTETEEVKEKKPRGRKKTSEESEELVKEEEE